MIQYIKRLLLVLVSNINIFFKISEGHFQGNEISVAFSRSALQKDDFNGENIYATMDGNHS